MHLITWNSRGVVLGGYEWRLKSKPDVMVVQEAGNLPDEIGYGGDAYFGVPVEIGTVGGYRCIWCGWSKQDDDGDQITKHNLGNLRCSLAMFYKERGMATAVWAKNEKRPLLKKTINKWLVCNIHAGGMAYINDALGIARSYGYEGKWVVAGDFNQDPPTIEAIIKDDEFVIAPDTPTRKQSGRILDFGVSNQDGEATVGPDYEGSDHLSVDILWP